METEVNLLMSKDILDITAATKGDAQVAVNCILSGLLTLVLLEVENVEDFCVTLLPEKVAEYKAIQEK